ncbi:hypothetical protein BamIOP4010DRAFT_5756 [Burkholderia ambifaria IOP40-10]|uniref:Uncharacterized protein n=1 Tax=Burkholderia ambifaria IOP40-10 TaxID=396596 RepID=B1FNZ5_9BURK|nr:hypothetical protein [Burkholderia ambifaria]EDT00720.1 hypothetical protein BamIOP4010DRAFT_5756 [Burkholderia ambifaria IOP40-10]
MSGIALNHVSPTRIAGWDTFADDCQGFGKDMASVKNGPSAMPASPQLAAAPPDRAGSRGGLNGIGDRSPGAVDGKKLAADLQGVGGPQAQECAAASPGQARIEHAASTDRYLNLQMAAATKWMGQQLGGDFTELMNAAKFMERHQLEDLVLNCYLLSHSGTKPMSRDVKNACCAFIGKAQHVVKDPSRNVDGFHQGNAQKSFKAVHSKILNELGASAIFHEAINDFKARAERGAVDLYLSQRGWDYSGPASDVIDLNFKSVVENLAKMFEAASSKSGSMEPDEVGAWLATAVRTIARVEPFIRPIHVPGDADTEKKPASLPESDETGKPSTDAMPETAARPNGLSARKPGAGPWGGGDMDAMRFSQWDNCFSPQFHVKTDTAEAFQVAMEPIKEMLNMLQLLIERLKPHEALPSAAGAHRHSADQAPDASTEQTVASVPVPEMEAPDSTLVTAEFEPPPAPPMPNAREQPRFGPALAPQMPHAREEPRAPAAPPDWQATKATHVNELGEGDVLRRQITQGLRNLRPTDFRKVLIEESYSVPDTNNQSSVTQDAAATADSGATSTVSQISNEQHTGGHKVEMSRVVVLTNGGQRGGTNAGATSVRSSS